MRLQRSQSVLSSLSSTTSMVAVSPTSEQQPEKGEATQRPQTTTNFCTPTPPSLPEKELILVELENKAVEGVEQLCDRTTGDDKDELKVGRNSVSSSIHESVHVA